MNLALAAGFALALLLAGYLVVALLKPEWFQ